MEKRRFPLIGDPDDQANVGEKFPRTFIVECDDAEKAFRIIELVEEYEGGNLIRLAETSLGHLYFRFANLHPVMRDQLIFDIHNIDEHAAFRDGLSQREYIV